MLEPGRAQQRINIPYFEGVNSLVSFMLGKKTELFHAENARSKIIGTIEKREGQTVLGMSSSGDEFRTSENWGIFSFQNPNNRGLYRICKNEEPYGVISESISPSASLSPSGSPSPSSSDSISASASASISPSASGSYSQSPSISTSPSRSKSPSASISPSASPSAETERGTIYYLNGNNHWHALTGGGADIVTETDLIFDTTYAEGSVFLVNRDDENRYIEADGTTVVTALDASGHLYNTPRASVVNFYKNRLYLGDFINANVSYPTTILRSSYPMGIISLLNADYSSLASGSTIDVTDIKYFYTTTGANLYDVYRGTNLISTITVTAINQTSITATWNGTPTFFASDEIWIAGTYGGEKIFRWVNNPTMSGKEVRQYDTFKLSGGENDSITMMTNIGNVMMIANKSTIASWNDYTLENFDMEVGCASRTGFVKSMGTLYFLDYNGIYSTTGGIPQLVSNKVERYINGATKSGKEVCAAGRKGRSIFFAIGDVTLYKPDGSLEKVLPNTCLEYNIVQQNWFVHTNVDADQFATFIEETDSDRLEFIDGGGIHSVKEFLSGDTDDGEEIHFRIDTMKLTTQPNNFEYSSKLIALLAESERGSAVQVFVNLENEEEYYPLEGRLTKGLSVVKFSDKDADRGRPPYCRMVSVSLRDSSKQRCKINRMTLIHLPTTDENMDNED